MITFTEIATRDHWACVCCGEPIAGRRFNIIRRDRHGSDSPANLLTFLGAGVNPLDPGDHRARVESGIDPNDKAKGYEIAPGQDPTSVSVMVFSSPDSGILAWPTDEGGWAYAPPEGTVAA